MVKIIEVYTLPLTGTMLNWRTLSGDTNDPVRPVGVKEFESSFNWTTVPASDEGMRQHLVGFDTENDSCEVEVEAHPLFHTALANHLRGKSLNTIASDRGQSRLMRGSNPGPDHEIVFNHRRKQG